MANLDVSPMIAALPDRRRETSLWKTERSAGLYQSRITRSHNEMYASPILWLAALPRTRTASEEFPGRSSKKPCENAQRWNAKLANQGK
jgi:hypothetical protein